MTSIEVLSDERDSSSPSSFAAMLCGESGLQTEEEEAWQDAEIENRRKRLKRGRSIGRF